MTKLLLLQNFIFNFKWGRYRKIKISSSSLLLLCPTSPQILYASGKIYMIFFVVISFWLAFYMASLFLGILAMTYEMEKQRISQKPRDMELKFQRTMKDHEEGNEATEVQICHFKIHHNIRRTQSLGVYCLVTDDHIFVYSTVSEKKCSCWGWKVGWSIQSMYYSCRCEYDAQYPCQSAQLPETAAPRVSDTVFWTPQAHESNVNKQHSHKPLCIHLHPITQILL